MQETRLLLIRHAETSAPEVFHGAESDIGLSAWGRHQALALAESLKREGLAAVYSSAMRRAVDTAAPVAAACGLRAVPLPELHERRIGPLSGLSREAGWEIYAHSKQRWMAGDLEFTHEGGESFAEIGRRVVPVVLRLVRQHEGQSIALILHGIVIRVLLLALLEDLGPSDFDRIPIDFASINDLRLGLEPRCWRAVALNRIVAASPARPVA